MTLELGSAEGGSGAAPRISHAAVGGTPFAAARELKLADADETGGGLGTLRATAGSTGFESANSLRPRREICRSARLGLAWYRLSYVQHVDRRNRALLLLDKPLLHVSWPPGRHPRSCADARYLAKVWAPRAARAREETERVAKWADRIVLEDVPYADGNNAWLRAVDEVQAVFPGSRGWLISCSAPEGGHGRWVVHGGGDYYPGAEHAKGGAEVGGNMQYTYGTFSGHFRRGLEYLLSKGYRVPPHLRVTSVTAWRSALGQAIAGGAAYFLGLRGNHWSASHGNGC